MPYDATSFDTVDAVENGTRHDFFVSEKLSFLQKNAVQYEEVYGLILSYVSGILDHGSQPPGHLVHQHPQIVLTLP